jgi:hypothetical protein
MRFPCLLAILTTLSLSACRSATIEATEEVYDFSLLRTWQWVSPEKAGLPGLSPQERQWSRGIARVVAGELEERGYHREEVEPDFLVLVAATTQRGRRVGGTPNRGSGARSRIRGSDFHYEEGMIAIRAWERQRGILIWECWARDVIRETEPPTEESVAELVRDMMTRWPAEVPPAERRKR